MDLNVTDIGQEQFEDFLYKTMLVFGYGEPQISCYRMMSRYADMKQLPSRHLVLNVNDK